MHEFSDPPRTAVVLGGSWFVGRAIVEALLGRGCRVITVNRGITPVSYSAPVRRVRSDRLQPDRFYETLRDIEADFLVDVTAYKPGDTRVVLDAFRNRIARAVHISTLSVYRQPAPGPIPEEWPLEDDRERAYGFQKAECERLLAAEPVRGFPWSILRLPPVYGPGDPISREHFYYRRAISGSPILIPEDGRFLCQNIFIEDVGKACCRLLEDPRSIGRAYNIGARPFALWQYAEMIFRISAKRAPLINVKREWMEMMGSDMSALPYFFPHDLVLETSKIKKELGFEPAVALERGLALTKRWLDTNPPLDVDFWKIPSKIEALLKK